MFFPKFDVGRKIFRIFLKYILKYKFNYIGIIINFPKLTCVKALTRAYAVAG